MSKNLFESGDAQGGNVYSVSPYGSSPARPNQPQMPQGQQPMYPPQNYGGYPQGYRSPGPRSSDPYPHNANQPPQYSQSPQGIARGPPLQSQWGQQQAGAQLQGQKPPPGPGYNPQQRPPVNGATNPNQYGARPPPPPQGNNPQGGNPPQQGQQQGRYPNPNQHPGWSSF